MKAAQPGDKGDIAACRRVLTFNNLRNVVTIDLHFITLLIFVADKAGIVIYGGVSLGAKQGAHLKKIMRPSLVAMT